jgi:hypothetical protein
VFRQAISNTLWMLDAVRAASPACFEKQVSAPLASTQQSPCLPKHVFREHVLGPMLHRRSSRPQRGVRKIELDGGATEALVAVVADHDRKSVSAALMNAARLYLELREDERPKVPTPGMPDLLVPLLATE